MILICYDFLDTERLTMGENKRKYLWVVYFRIIRIQLPIEYREDDKSEPRLKSIKIDNVEHINDINDEISWWLQESLIDQYLAGLLTMENNIISNFILWRFIIPSGKSFSCWESSSTLALSRSVAAYSPSTWLIWSYPNHSQFKVAAPPFGTSSIVRRSPWSGPSSPFLIMSTLKFRNLLLQLRPGNGFTVNDDLPQI